MSSANEKKKRTFKNKYGRNETTLFERIVDEKKQKIPKVKVALTGFVDVESESHIGLK